MRILAVGDFQGVFPGRLRSKLRREKFDLVVGVGDYAGIKEWRAWVMADLASVKKGNGRISPEGYFGKEKFKLILKKDFEAGKYVLRSMDGLGKPGVFVFGNGDDDWYSYPFNGPRQKIKKSRLKVIRGLKNVKEITYSKRKLNGVNFVGFGGYMDIDSYFDKKNWKEAKDKKSFSARVKRRERSKRKLFAMLKKMKGEKIFVLHYPPKGVFDIIRDKKDNPMNGKSAGIGFFAEAIRKYRPRLVLCGHMHEYQGMKKLHGVPVVNPGDAEKGKAAIIEIDNKKGNVKIKFVR